MLTLRQILNAALVRAKPLFENFSLIQAFCNNLQDQIDAFLTPPAGNEVTNARDYATVLRDRLRGASKSQGNVWIEGLVVTAQGTPDMTVHIATGKALVDGVFCEPAAADTAAITAPSANPRYDIVVVNSDNSITVITGTEAASPVYPAIAASQRPLYAIPLIVGQTTITTASLIDLRRNVKSNGLYNAIEIYNQEDFEFYFGDGTETGTGLTQGGFAYSESSGIVTVDIPESKTIFLYDCASGGTNDTFNGNNAFLLKTILSLNNYVSIIGFNENKTIIAKNSQYVFIKIVGSSGNEKTGIILNGWSFDGRKSSYTKAGYGGAFNLSYVNNCELNCKIINHKVASGGGAIYGSNTTYIKSEKIFSCDVTVGHGGAVQGCDYSIFKAKDCTASSVASGGGSYYDCNYSFLIGYGGSCGAGGGHMAWSCNYCTIKAYDCYVGAGSIIYECTNCESIWITSGSISSSSLGGVRLVVDESDSSYTTPAVAGAYTTP